MSTDAKAVITKEVLAIIDTEQGLKSELSKLESQLAENPVFAQFLIKQSELNLANSKAADIWKQVEVQMIENDIKKIEGTWGSLTIAERLDFDIDDEVLAPRYKKTVADTTKIRTMYQLDRKDIPGATPKYKKYLTKQLKLGGNNGE